MSDWLTRGFNKRGERIEQLEQRIAELEAENKQLLAAINEEDLDALNLERKHTALLEKLRELISDIDKLNELLRWDRDGWDAPESIVFAASDLSKNAHAIIEQEKNDE